MAKFGAIPTAQEVEKIYEAANAGDQSAIDKLGELNNRLAKRANERMRDLERKGFADTTGGTYSYDRAKYWISEQYGGDYFKQNKKTSNQFGIDEMMENIDAASNYLRSQTSTASGERRRRANIVDSLEEKGMFEDIEGDTTDIKKQLLDFFDTDAWEDIRKHNKGGTNPMVAEAIEAINNGALLGDLKRAFRDFQRGADTDYIEIWENWRSANQYYKGGGWHTLKQKRR